MYQLKTEQELNEIIDSLLTEKDESRKVKHKHLLVAQFRIALKKIESFESAQSRTSEEQNAHLLKLVHAATGSFLKTLDFDVTESKGSGRPQKYSPLSDDPEGRETYFKVIQLFKKGVPISQISDKLAISRNTVYKIIKEI